MLNKKKTIAVLMHDVASGYHIPLTRAVIEIRRDYDFLPIFIVAGALPQDPCEWDSTSVKLYSMLFDLGVDAALVSSPIFQSLTDDPQALGEFRKRLGDRPVSVISSTLPDSCCLTIDNKKAMRSVLDHLARNHGCRKYAFLSGPESSPEARDRLYAVKEFTAQMDGSIDMSIWKGDFQRLQTYDLVFEKIKNKETCPDVVVCVNDESALGVLRICYQLKLRIPEDILVTGFDDIERSVYSVSSLTTVHQPIFEAGTRGILVLRKMLEGYTLPENQVMDTTLIVRDSCGCRQKLPRKAKNASVTQVKEAVTIVKPEVIEEINKSPEYPESVKHIFKEVARSFFAALAGSKNSQTVLEHIRSAIFRFFSEHEYKRSYYHGLKNILTSIDQRIRAVGVSEDIQHLCNEVLGRAGMDLMEVWLKEEIGSRYDEEYYQLWFNDFSEKITLVENFESLTKIFDTQLPRVGIENLMVFYQTSGQDYLELNKTGLKLVYCPIKYRGTKLSASSILAKAGDDSPDGLFCRPIPESSRFSGFMALSMNEQFCLHFDRIAFPLTNLLAKFLNV